MKGQNKKFQIEIEQMSHCDCSICMSEIGDKNRVVTDCGHMFHASCLMQHVSHNGYGCPYCRNNMVKEKEQHKVNEQYLHVDINPPIDYIIDHMHRSCYSYEDLVKILCMHTEIPYYNNHQDIDLIYGFFEDMKNALEMYVEPSLPYLDEIEEVDSV